MSQTTESEPIELINPQTILEKLPEYLTGEYGLALALLAGWGAYALYREFRGPKRIKGSAFWAKPAHIRKARQLVLENLAGQPGSEFSYQMGNLPLFDVVTSIISFGAPKTGKSFGSTNQAIYEHLKRGQPQVIVDLQYPEQTSLFVHIAQRLGYSPRDIHLFVPGEPTSGIWNPIQHAHGSRSVEMTRLMLDNTREKGTREDGFFGPAGRYIVSGTMAMCRCIPGLDDIAGCQAFLSFQDFPQRLIAYEDKLMQINPWAYNQFTQFLANAESEKTAANIVGAALNLFGQFCSEDIAPAVTGKTTIPIKLSGKQLLIIGCTPGLRSTVAPLLMSLLSLIVSENAIPDRQDYIQVAIDEFTAVEYKRLIQDLNELRKFKLFFNLATQTPSQIQSRYGEDGKEAFLTAVGHKIWLNPRENKSAKYLETALGNRRYRETQFSKGYSGGKSNTNRSKQTKETPLLPAHEILKLPKGVAIVQSPGICSEAQAYIPWKTWLEPGKEYKARITEAKQGWDFTRKQLVRFSPLREIDGYEFLKGYKDSAAAVMPPLPDAEEAAVAEVRDVYEAEFRRLF